ncbi:hypothetical protein ACFE04_031086 [Oxalis oulophora]
MESTKLFLYLLLLIQIATTTTTTTNPFPKQSLPSKSGYLSINPSSKSSLFYTFYEAQNQTTPISKTPLLIWLQGGPGCSSMIGNFYELGPWRVNRQLTLEPNPGSWNRIFGLLFIDNPIGTGFSIAANPDEIPRTQHVVAKHLFEGISVFLDQNPEFKTRPLYITGESYAGKYVPAIGYYILKRNPQLPVSKRLNLGGVAIGNGLTDPITQVATHANNAYFSGLVNERQKGELEKAQLEAIRFVKMENWSEAAYARSNVLDLLQNMTGLATLYDYTRKIPYESDLVANFLQSKEVKKALGVSENIVFEECSDVVGEALSDDVMKNVKYMVEFLVKNSRVLLYQGQYDLRDGVVSTEAWVKKLRWENIEKFLSADRKVWQVNNVVAGYVQKWGSLSQVVVSGAGHLVPTDQSVNSQVMIENWVLETGLFGEEQSLTSNFVKSLEIDR